MTSNLDGDWAVDENPEVPGFVRLQMTEFDEDGGEQKEYYLPPQIAEDMASSLTAVAYDIADRQ